MTRRVGWMIAAAVAILALGGWWFATHFERVPVKTHQSPGPEALRNPYLALERFMARMGRPFTRTSDVRALDTLGPVGVLILDRNRRALMTTARIDALFKWVGNGGYLVVVPEYRTMPDPVLSYLQVEPATRVSGTGAPAPAAASSVAAPASAASAPASGFKRASESRHSPTVVAIPGSARTLNVSYMPAGLKAGAVEPEWRVALDSGGDWLLHYRYGLGHVALVTSLDRVLANEAIGQFDHAEFFWTLLRHYQPAGPVTLLTRPATPDLFDWLLENAWAALISAAALLALWVWRVVPRFGTVRPDALPARRELREHLNAMGRFVWHTEGFGRWLEAARASFHERLARRHPAIAAMAHRGQADALAKLTSRPSEIILRALHGKPDSASEFTAMLRTLKDLKHDL